MFKLINYEKEIRDYVSRNQEVSLIEALNSFIYNLTVMQPAVKGFDETVDFRYLGQQWNKLKSAERVAQKNEIQSILSKTPRTRTTVREYKEEHNG